MAAAVATAAPPAETGSSTNVAAPALAENDAAVANPVVAPNGMAGDPAATEGLAGDPAAPSLTAAVVVPVPAPRGASLNEGMTLAFVPPAGSEALSAATQIAAPPAAAIVEPAAPAAPDAAATVSAPAAIAPPAPVADKPKTLFEALFARNQQREQAARARTAVATSTSQPVRTASLQASPPAVAAQPRQDNALPGVQSGRDLFGIGPGQEDDGDDGGEEVEVASAAGLARLSPNGLLKQTDKVVVECFPPELVRLLKRVEAHYGRKVVVTSGYRSAKANRRAGGARKSIHIQCKAADIQVANVSKWDLAKYLRTVPGRGGVGTYCRTKSVHIDIGPERDWHYPCRRAKKKRKA